MDVKIEDSWKAVLAEEFEKSYFSELTSFVRNEYKIHIIYPPAKLIFNAFWSSSSTSSTESSEGITSRFFDSIFSYLIHSSSLMSSSVFTPRLFWSFHISIRFFKSISSTKSEFLRGCQLIGSLSSFNNIRLMDVLSIVTPEVGSLTGSSIKA